MKKHVINSSIKTLDNATKKLYNSAQKYRGNDKEILIAALELDLDKNDKYYKSYCKGKSSDQFPYEKIIFACDELTISEPCSLPSCDVQIFARKLIFKNKGSISTSGSDQNIGKGKAGTTGKDGKDGKDAGNVSIFCKELDTSKSTADQLIIARGGHGQDPQEGKNGKDGQCNTRAKRAGGGTAWLSSLYDVLQYFYERGDLERTDYNDYHAELMNSNYDYGQRYKEDTYFRRAHVNAPSGWKDRYYNKSGDEKPTDGGDATEPGLPGRGGNGGKLMINYCSDPKNESAHAKAISNLIHTFDGTQGKAGKPSKDVKGGNAGQPERTVNIEFDLGKPGFLGDMRVSVKTHGPTIVTKDGKSYKGKKSPNGARGYVVQLQKPHVWLHPALVELFIDWAKDQYLLGEDFNSLQNRLKIYAQDLLAFTPSKESAKDADKPHPDKLYWLDNPHIPFSTAQTTISNMLAKLDSNLDYYGNQPGFMPSVSVFGARYYYDNELDDALSTIILTRALDKTYKDQKDKRAILSKLIEDTNEKMKKKEAAITAAWDVLESKEPDIKRLEKEEKAKAAAIKKRKGELKSQAETDEKKARLVKTGFDVASIALKAIPYGQPALGMVGGTASDIIGEAVVSNLKEGAFDTSKAADVGDFYYAYKMYKKKDTYDEDLVRKKDLRGYLKKLRKGKIVNLHEISEINRKKEADRTDEEREKLSHAIESRKTRSQARAEIARLNKKAALVTKAASQAKSAFNNLKVDQATLERLYQKLLSDDSELQNLIIEIKALQEEKAKLYKEIEEQMAIISASEAYFIQAATIIQNATLQQAANERAFNDGVMDILKDLQSDAFERIYYFQYLLIKAYEAEFLKPFNKLLVTKKFITELDKLLKTYSTSLNLINSIEPTKKILKDLIYEQCKFSVGDINSALRKRARGTNLSFTIPFAQRRRGVVNAYCKAINEAISSTNDEDFTVLFPLSAFRKLADLKKFNNSKIASIKLDSLSFKFVDKSTGKIILDSEGNPLIDERFSTGKTKSMKRGTDKYTFDNSSSIFSLRTPMDGIVRMGNKNYALRPDQEWIWTWEYDFVNGKKPLDAKPEFSDSIMDAVNRKRTEKGLSAMEQNKVYAQVPLEGDYRLKLSAPDIEITHVDGKTKKTTYITARAIIHELDFSIKFYGISR